jgi:hypothetical protein
MNPVERQTAGFTQDEVMLQSTHSRKQGLRGIPLHTSVTEPPGLKLTEYGQQDEQNKGDCREKESVRILSSEAVSQKVNRYDQKSRSRQGKRIGF